MAKVKPKTNVIMHKDKKVTKSNRSIMRKGLLTMMILFMSFGTKAQGDYFNSPEFMVHVIVSMTFFIALLVLIVAIYVLQILKAVVKDTAIKKAKEKGVEYVEAPNFWAQFNTKLTNAVPIEEEASIDLNHDYDGIRELDNHLPPWWTYLFYGTIVFAVVYMFIYHVADIWPLQIDEYKDEIALAEVQKASLIPEESSNIDENNVEFSDDATILASGETIYQRQCAACHKALGEGGIGPNLTDEYWIHGGSMSDIYRTIRYGVPDKGMISWEPLLSPTQMRDVSAYIVTLQGTNPPNAKDPQGELYKPETPGEVEAETGAGE